MGIPDLDKMGKGAQLRRAVEYVADVSDRMIVYEKEVDDLRKEKQDLEVCHLSALAHNDILCMKRR